MAHPTPDFLPSRRYILSGLAACVASPAWAMDRFVKAGAPKPLPDLPFVDGDDKATTFTAFKGKAILVNFWATWCAPCVKEMPSLDRLQAAIGTDKFAVLPLSLDGPTRAKVAPFYADRKLDHLHVWFDKGRKLMQALDVSILPTSILASPTGEILGRLEGEADWDKADAVALIKSALGA